MYGPDHLKALPALQEGSSFVLFGTYYLPVDCTLQAGKTSEIARAAQSGTKINRAISSTEPGSHRG